LELLFDNGDQNIGGDGAPNLRLHRVLAGTQKLLDAQMLLDPLEEQFHLPAILIKLGNHRCRQRRVVGQKDQRLTRGILVSHPAQMLRIVFGRLDAIERHRLITHHASALIHLVGVHASCVEVGLGACHKKGTCLMHREQPGKVQIAAIHDVESPSLKWQDIEHIDITHLAIADVNEARDAAAQVQQRMQLDGRLGRAKRCPTKQTQAQVNRAGIQRVHLASDVDIQSQRFIGIELVGAANQHRCKVSPDAPIASFVGIGQSGSTHCLTQTHTVELGRIGAQRGLNIAQRFAPGELRIGHDAEMLGAGKSRNPRVPRVASHDPREAGPGHEVHDLREKRLSRIHNTFPKLST